MATVDELRARLAKVEALASCASASACERATAGRIAAGLRRELAARGVAAVAPAVRGDAAALERERARAALELEVQRRRLAWLAEEYERARAREALELGRPAFVEYEAPAEVEAWGTGGRFERPGWR